MDTNDLKRLIGSDCLVIDPRSKKKEFEPATIIRATYSISRINGTDKTYEHISYDVALKKVSIRKRGFRANIEYNRGFTVSGDKIQTPF